MKAAGFFKQPLDNKKVDDPLISAINPKLLPTSCRIDDSGSLFLGNLRVADLAAQFGTPLFIYDTAHIRQRCAEFLNVFGQGSVAYANKAFTCKALVKFIHKEGLKFDVSSGGELATVLAAGVSGRQCIVHGSNKSKAELLKALEAEALIAVDSLDEVWRLKELLASGNYSPQFLLRLAPGLQVETHQYLATGTLDSKFGLSAADGSLQQAIKELRRLDGVRVVGVHAHIGSQIIDLKTYRLALSQLMQQAQATKMPLLSIGGGLGVAYTAEIDAPTIAELGQAVDWARQKSGFEGAIWVEPGRSIIAQAALTVYEIGTIKEIAGIRHYVSVDGGMIDNPRPALYQSQYEAFLPELASSKRDLKVSVVGKCCESGDILVNDGWLPSAVKVGDLLATPMSGAYHYSMSSNYHRLPRPAVVFVDGSQVKVAIRRQSDEDLLLFDN